MNIGIIGTGKVAHDSYLPFLSSQEDVSLFYYNRTKEKAEACAAEFGGEVCDSITDLVAKATDSVFVLTSEKARGTVLQELVPLKPARLFMEKPLVAANGQDNVTENDFVVAQDIMSKLHSDGCQTAMIFNYRFFDQTLAAKKIVETRKFGKAVSATAVVNYACWSHCIDLMLDFVGPAATICAQESGMKHKGGVSDISATVSFESGAVGTIIGTWALNFGFPLYELTINFEGGRIHMRGLDGDMEVLDYSTKHQETLALTRNTGRWDQYKESFKKSLDAYLKALRAGNEPPVPGMAGLLELQFEAGMRRSVSEERPVNLAEEFAI